MDYYKDDDYMIDVDYLVRQADRDLFGVFIVVAVLLTGIFSTAGGLLWYALS